MFIVATTGAAIVGGLLLYGLDSSAVKAPLSKNSSLAATFKLHSSLHRLSFWQRQRISGSSNHALRYDKTWIDNRIKAEAGRLDRARATLEIGHETGPEAFSSAGKNFLKEIVDGQLNYLSKAAQKSERKGRELVVIAAIVSGIAALTAGLAGVNVAGITLIGALVGVVSPAFIAALKSWESAMSDQERSALHGITWEKLNTLSGQRREFEAAVENKDLAAALSWAESVFAVLREDHKGFHNLLSQAPIEGQDTDDETNS